MKEEEKNIKLPFYGIPRLFPYIKPYRGRMAVMVLLGAATSAIDAAYPLFNRYALDHFIGEQTLNGIVIFIMAYVALLIGQAVMNYVSAFACGKLEMTVNKDLRNAAFNHLQTLSFSYYNQNSVGYIHARVMSDTGLIGESVSWRLMNIVWSGSYVLGVLIVMLFIDIRLAACILVLVPAAVLLMMYFQKKILKYNRLIREINSKITGSYNEGITGAKSIKVLGIEEKMKTDFKAETREMKKTSVREAHVSALFISTVTMLSSVTLAIVLWQGGQLTLANAMRIGTLSVFMSYALEMLDPIQGIIETLAGLAAIQVNIERLTRLLAEKSDVADSEEVIAKYGDMFEPKKENWEELCGDVEFRDVSFRYPDGDEYVLEHFNLKVPQGTNIAIVGETGAGKSTLVNLVCRFFEPKKENWESLKGDVEFRDVSFKYPDGDEYILEHFDLKIPFGTNVAIVGETGAGKSTLANLVCRFYEPTAGSVLIDGRDARERSQLWLHSAIGYVLQTPHLFSGTVRENLLYAKPDATDEEIERALKLVSADEVVARLEKGLETDVGEGGDMLSTGEKQLISFARAILADPRILVLDEATSAFLSKKA